MGGKEKVVSRVEAMLFSTLESSQWKLDGGDAVLLVAPGISWMKMKLLSEEEDNHPNTKERKFKASDGLPVLTSTILENIVVICVQRFEI